jgi:hypothetical protein
MEALYQLSYRGVTLAYYNRDSGVNLVLRYGEYFGNKKHPRWVSLNPYLVLEVGLEPTKPKGGRFTVSCDCHYTIPAYGAALRIRTVDLLFTKQLL